MTILVCTAYEVRKPRHAPGIPYGTHIKHLVFSPAEMEQSDTTPESCRSRRRRTTKWRTSVIFIYTILQILFPLGDRRSDLQ
jgi:hypothetical protein